MASQLSWRVIAHSLRHLQQWDQRTINLIPSPKYKQSCTLTKTQLVCAIKALPSPVPASMPEKINTISGENSLAIGTTTLSMASRYSTSPYPRVLDQGGPRVPQHTLTVLPVPAPSPVCHGAPLRSLPEGRTALANVVVQNIKMCVCVGGVHEQH